MTNEIFEKISVEKELPTEDGKYVIFTKSKFLGRVNVLTVNLNLRGKKGKVTANWGCTNQIVTHWLKRKKC